MEDDSAYISVLESLKNYSKSLPSQSVWSFLNDNGDIIDSYTFAVGIETN